MKKVSFLFLILLMIGLDGKAQDHEGEQALSFNQNSIHFNMSDVIFKRVGFEYEHVLGDGHLSIKIPFSYSFGDPDGMYKSLYNSNLNGIPLRSIVDFTDWYLGLGANLYPKGQGKIRFYLGTEIRLGSAHKYDEGYYDEYYYYYADDGEEDDDIVYEKHDYFQTTFFVNAGFQLHPIENIVVSINLSIGASSSYDDDIDFLAHPSFRMGYSF